jgi:uncharacterized protein YbjT (DUF2867 family)
MKILLTGATGYIGRRLKQELLKDDTISLRLFVRNANKIREHVRKKVEIVEGDTFDKDALKKATHGVDVAYYLIHSMGTKGDYKRLDRISAENFRDACIEGGVKKIIYLGGLGVKETASKHLLSRIETGEILSARPDDIQTIWFRAGVIIGSGSASFEIIRNLVQKLPVMITPKWVWTKTEPIAVTDILRYLKDAKDISVDGNLIVDIGSEIMSFRDMLLKTAKVMKLSRVLVPVPVLTPKLSSYWLILMTPIPFSIASALVEGLKSETVIQNDNARRYFPHITPFSYEEAVRNALREIENRHVISCWCDSSAKEVCDIKHQDDTSQAILVDRKEYSFRSLSPHSVFSSIITIGGHRGWFRYNTLWEVRGLFDKFIGGYGINRGRRDEQDLRVGDSLDFWKVVDLKKDKRLLLVAQMKVPGKAWLEFTIDNNILTQTAYFYPKGLWGRLYWYLMLPFHYLVFEDIAQSIIKQAANFEDKEKLDSQ